jgi:hypothetical protein
MLTITSHLSRPCISELSPLVDFDSLMLRSPSNEKGRIRELRSFRVCFLLGVLVTACKINPALMNEITSFRSETPNFNPETESADLSDKLNGISMCYYFQGKPSVS